MNYLENVLTGIIDEAVKEYKDLLVLTTSYNMPTFTRTVSSVTEGISTSDWQHLSVTAKMFAKPPEELRLIKSRHNYLKTLVGVSVLPCTSLQSGTYLIKKVAVARIISEFEVSKKIINNEAAKFVALFPQRRLEILETITDERIRKAIEFMPVPTLSDFDVTCELTVPPASVETIFAVSQSLVEEISAQYRAKMAAEITSAKAQMGKELKKVLQTTLEKLQSGKVVNPSVLDTLLAFVRDYDLRGLSGSLTDSITELSGIMSFYVLPVATSENAATLGTWKPLAEDLTSVLDTVESDTQILEMQAEVVHNYWSDISSGRARPITPEVADVY